MIPSISETNSKDCTPLDEMAATAASFVEGAISFAREQDGPQDIHEAWKSFRCWMTDSTNFQAEDWKLFLAWYVFHWKPNCGPECPSQNCDSIAERYLKAFPEAFHKEAKTQFLSATKTPLDFYQIQQIPEQGCYYLKSLFLGQEQSYAFKELPDGLSAGCIFFAKILHFRDDRGIIAGHSKCLQEKATLAISKLRLGLIAQREEEYIKNFALFDSDVLNLYNDLLI